MLQSWHALFATTSLVLFSAVPSARAVTNVFLTEVPDYEWWAGCFGTASGNLMGYWDRHGFPNFYTGPTGRGLAPLTSVGANQAIRALWASQAGVDGRPRSLPGHYDDYYIEYESTAPDPYVTASRPEHSPDCIGDFIGLNQNKFADLGNECAGNIDAFSFVYWDSSGDRRTNFTPLQDGIEVPDIQSGFRKWTQFRGHASDVFTQLTDFNPVVEPGKGFSFEDLKAEIDAGYPVLLFLQDFTEFSRPVGDLPNANPHLHGMLAYGYRLDDRGRKYVRYRTSWASGSQVFSEWTADFWQADLPVRGVIGYHPLPQITSVSRSNDFLTVSWAGPASVLTNVTSATGLNPHGYVLEKANSIPNGPFEAVSSPTLGRTMTITNCCGASAFYHVRLIHNRPEE